MNDPKQLLKELNDIRVDKNISKEAVIKNSTMSKMTVYNASKGSTNLSVKNLCEYANAIQAKIVIVKNL